MNEETRKFLQRRAFEASPYEVCGFIMEDGSIVEIRNVATNRIKGFRMDRDEMIQKLSDRADFIKGIWHTHPSGTIHPSHTDLNAIRMGAIQRNWDYWIVTASSVSLYIPNHYAPQDNSFWSEFAK